MNSKLVIKDTNSQPSKKILLRSWGVFALLGAITFAIQWRFSLGNIGTSLLVIGLGLLFGFAFPKLATRLQRQPQDALTKPIFRITVGFVWLIIGASALSIIWLGLSLLTGIPHKLLAAITLALTAFILIVWSYIPIPDE